jgi:hypothetical protein
MGQHRPTGDGLVLDNFERLDPGREWRTDDGNLPRGDENACREERSSRLRLLRQGRDFDAEQFGLFVGKNQILCRVRLLQGQREGKGRVGSDGNRNGSKPENCGAKSTNKSSEREHHHDLNRNIERHSAMAAWMASLIGCQRAQVRYASFGIIILTSLAKR